MTSLFDLPSNTPPAGSVRRGAPPATPGGDGTTIHQRMAAQAARHAADAKERAAQARREAQEALLADLNPQQREAVEHALQVLRAKLARIGIHTARVLLRIAAVPRGRAPAGDPDRHR